MSDCRGLPPSCAVAFKEWSGVCAALEAGRQTIILRKGGIAEGPGGFRPEHDAFWLYPTQVHEGQQGLREELIGLQDAGFQIPDSRIPDSRIDSGARERDCATLAGRGDVGPAARDVVSISALVHVGLVARVARRETLDRIEPFHVWTAETVGRRFDYRGPGLWLLAVRVLRAEEPWRVPVTPEQAGCKTWVTLDAALPTDRLRPVLDEDTFTRRLDALRAALGKAGEVFSA